MVVDTSALIAIVSAEAGHEALLHRLLAADIPVLPAHCLLEAHIVLTARYPAAMLATLDGVVAAVGLRTVPFTPEHAALARQAFSQYGKGRHPAGLNFGDCMSYAVAKAEGLPLLYVGADFSQTDLAS